MTAIIGAEDQVLKSKVREQVSDDDDEYGNERGADGEEEGEGDASSSSKPIEQDEEDPFWA